jgi:aerobic carbon-monoxide dehydrogenase large subunit
MAVVMRPAPGWARTEDDRLVRGAGRFTDDLQLVNAAVGVVVRSPHAAAEIVSIETAQALQTAGVLAIYTAADLAGAGIAGLPCVAGVANRDGSPAFSPLRPALATKFVRHVGEPVAFVVAKDRQSAMDGAEAVQVVYDVKQAVVGVEAARAPAAAAVWAEASDNRAFDWETGKEAETAALFARAAHITRLRVVNNRLVPAAMEPRSAFAQYDQATERWTLHAPSQGAWFVRDILASAALKVDPRRLRVITQDVGGSFGSKTYLYPEHVLVCHAAQALGRPVRWTADRSEAFFADAHGRDTVSIAELALDAEHHFLALRIHVLANMGSYLSTFAPIVPTVVGTSILPSVYRFRAVYAHVMGVFTHTVPIDAYRGAGMPEAIHVVERLIDEAARELGIDRAEIRKRNLIQADQIPFTSPSGSIYDSGAFPTLLQSALERADWIGFAERRRISAGRGLRRGIGLSCYLGTTGGPPVEFAGLRCEDERVILSIGTQASGQGHETIYASLLAERLGLPMNAIVVRQGDTDLLAGGGGTGGSRSLYAGGAAVIEAAARLIEEGRSLAAEALQAAPDVIEFRDGSFAVAGTERQIGLLALFALYTETAPARPAVDISVTVKTETPTFPNGCHIAEVEVDPETGTIDVVRYVTADDVGRVLDQRMARGQIQGGIAQGYGQAVRELAQYDADSGQLVTASFLDYAIPRAEDLPDLDVAFIEIPCTTNPLGSKGAGEAGTIGSVPTIVSAVLDALSEDRVRDLDTPLTSQKIWKSIQEGRKGARP